MTRRLKQIGTGWRWRTAPLRDHLRFQSERACAYAAILPVLLKEPALRNRDGIRFLEMKYLLTRWLAYATATPEACRAICEQFDNVLSNCDSISYDEEGAAEAYVLLHFLDRYHRFQMICAELESAGAMPRKLPLRVLDIGTGPGPSMFAISDHSRAQTWRLGPHSYAAERRVSIDYAEQSRGFRHWLHHFTELANRHAPSGVGWAVPFHHGSTQRFEDIAFDRRHAVWETDPDGDDRLRFVTEKVRPDLIVMSNFLTTEAQARGLAPRIQDCVRNLRHGGLLLVVGAQRSSAKYRGVYDVLETAVLEGRYSRAAYKAWCERVELARPIMGYDYADPWGRQIKAFLSEARSCLQRQLSASMPAEIDARLASATAPDYARRLQWEINVYRKVAIPRRRHRGKERQPAVQPGIVS